MRTHYDGPLHMMESIGGSFVKALADLYYRADCSNKLRLKVAFRDYFDHYEGLFKIHCAEREVGIPTSGIPFTGGGHD